MKNEAYIKDLIKELDNSNKKLKELQLEIIALEESLEDAKKKERKIRLSVEEVEILLKQNK
jgi:uncharacterized protein YlxW (UPF0749 family)